MDVFVTALAFMNATQCHTVCFATSLSFQVCGDEGIYWQVNFERFHLHFRHQAIISAVASKLDQVELNLVSYCI